MLAIASALLAGLSGNVLLCLAIVPALLVDLLIIWNICDWIQETEVFNPKLTFRQFIHIYSAIPEKFVLRRAFVKYDGTNVDFKTPIDLFIYKRFYRRREKYDERIKKLRIESDFVKAVQLDLNNKQEEISNFVKENILHEED